MARQQFGKKIDKENDRMARQIEKEAKKRERKVRDGQNKEELRKLLHGALFKPLLRRVIYGGHR